MREKQDVPGRTEKRPQNQLVVSYKWQLFRGVEDKGEVRTELLEEPEVKATKILAMVTEV